MMNEKEQLQFSPDFKQACEIFGLNPLDVVQQFVDNVSLPTYFSFPLRPDRWANMFMLECVLGHIKDETILNRCDKFLGRITDAIQVSKGDKEEICREVMDEWHRAVLEERIKDVMDDDET